MTTDGYLESQARAAYGTSPEFDSLDDMLIPEPSPPTPGMAARKCRRHDWVMGWQKCEPSYRWTESQQWPDDIPTMGCRRCHKVRDWSASRTGRNNRSRGNRAELAVARRYGGEKTGPLGGPEDVRGKDFRSQVKTHQGLPPLRWRAVFAKLDTQADGRIPRLIERYLPGQGIAADDYVIFRGSDFLEWFGRDE